jgi:hypothetical protein
MEDLATVNLALVTVVSVTVRGLHNDAVHYRSVYRSLLAKCGGDEKRAWARLKSYFAEELEGMEDSDEHLDWLLTEADRIGIDDPYRATASEPVAIAT